MKNILIFIFLLSLLASCNKNNQEEAQQITNPRLSLAIPTNFPPLNPLIETAYPTQYGVALGDKLFHDVRLSRDNSISCATCHIRGQAYGDRNPRAVGVAGRIGLRNTPPIQNMAFLTQYMWDGAVVDLKEQPVTPIVTHEEMDLRTMLTTKRLLLRPMGIAVLPLSECWGVSLNSCIP